jgi:hypothetical protein
MKSTATVTATEQYLEKAQGNHGGKAGVGYFKKRGFLQAITKDIEAYAALRARGYHGAVAFTLIFGQKYEDHDLGARVIELEYSREYRFAYDAAFAKTSLRTLVEEAAKAVGEVL